MAETDMFVSPLLELLFCNLDFSAGDAFHLFGFAPWMVPGEVEGVEVDSDDRESKF